VGPRLGRFAAIFLGAAVLAGVAAWFVTPSVDDIQLRVAALAKEHGTPLLSPGQIPALLAQAVVATEDERFYEHHGIDGIGLIRAGLDDLKNHCLCEGGSTLTEQLVKEVYLGGSDRGGNKLVDVVTAFKVETVIDKSRIMADWLTLAPTGPTSYGVQTSACTLFGRPLGKLSLAQYALLAGLPQSPILSDPLTHPEGALRRRSEVLDAMAAHRFISSSQASAASAEPLLPATRGGC
jgi:penicillin-binding protein 1A